MIEATLYGTSACHLCEQAEALLARLLSRFDPQPGARIELVDIAHDDALLARYGESIPVLRRDEDGVELRWPFDADAAWRLLSGQRP